MPQKFPNETVLGSDTMCDQQPLVKVKQKLVVLPSIFLQTSAMSSKPLLRPSRLEILTREKEMIDA